MDEDAFERRVESVAAEEPPTPLDAPRARAETPIRRLKAVGPRYLELQIEVGAELRERYRRPGQYVTLARGGLEPRFLVIASGPGARPPARWDFLIDRRTEMGRALADAGPDEMLSISPPEGSGYPVDDVDRRHVLCFATGSGIASIRPAVEYWQAHPTDAPDRLTVYYGESEPDEYAYRESIENWDARTFWCSRTGNATEFTYVQHAFDHDAPPLEDAVAFVSGSRAMKRAVVARLLREGLSLDEIVTNL